MPQFDISVVVPTYNRCGRLRVAIEALLQQEATGLTVELIIVDNNSTDGTEDLVQQCISRSKANIRYILQKRQGVSYGRNAGIQAANAPIIAFLDDDVCAHKDWIGKVKQTFDHYPEAVYLGGRVLPEWEAPAPARVKANLAPLALQDYGPNPRWVSSSWPVCLASANLACRRDVFATVGMFGTETQRVKDGIGSMEDHEWQMRVWGAGLKGIYVAGVAVTASVSAERLTKNYHRQWHFGQGRFRSLSRDPEFERPSWRLLDVPAHVYRKTAVHFLGGLKSRVRGDQHESFRQEGFERHSYLQIPPGDASSPYRSGSNAFSRFLLTERCVDRCPTKPKPSGPASGDLGTVERRHTL